MSRRISLIIGMLLLFSTACSLPSVQKTYTQEEAVQATVSAMLTNEPTSKAPVSSTSTKLAPTAIPTNTTAPSLASSTPLPTATVTATKNPIPCNLAEFVDDVNYPDGTLVITGTTFTKTWRLRNAGTCTWTSAYSLVFYDGAQMNGQITQPLQGTVSPGQTIDISVNLTAPATPNTYRGYWKLRDPNGEVFGLPSGAFWVEIHSMIPGPTAPTFAAWPTVKNGDSGPVVTALQYLLRFNNQTVTPDGAFGNQTRTAVVSFQNLTGLTADGIVGTNTWNNLVSAALLAQGINNEATRALQVLLKSKHGYSIDVDGVFGPATKAAVIDFQNDVNLTADGRVNPTVWQALISN